jgi:hypothetical protein
MSRKEKYIFDNIEQVELAKKDLQGVIIIDESLPKVVFNKDIKHFVIIEHGYLLTSKFVDILCAICSFYEDDIVNYLSLSPAAEYYRNVAGGVYGGFSLASAVVDDQYLPVMTLDGHVESFASRGGDVACIWGSSKNWGIFIDRITWELLVIGSKSEIPSSVFSHIRTIGDKEIKLYAQSQEISLHKIAELAQNYYPRCAKKVSE